jgi:hypothetical protein
MDFDEKFESIVERSLEAYDYRMNPILQPRILYAIHNPLLHLEDEAQETRLWLLDQGLWANKERTIKVPAPQGDEVQFRVLFPLTGGVQPRGRNARARYNLDSVARIWTRSSKGIYPREPSEFQGEPDVVSRLIKLLRATRGEVVTS